MKKETFYKTLETIVTKLGYRYSYIANKEFKDRCKKNMIRGKNQTEKEFSRVVDRKAKFQFQECLRGLIEESYLPPLKPHFIYIEKNHPPSSWEGTERLINEARGDLEVNVIGLIPKKIGEHFCYQRNSQTITYPLSAELFFTCLDRVQKREDHETLAGNGPQSVGVLLEFLEFFKGESLDENSLKNYGFDKFIYAPFTQEKSPVDIPSDLIDGLVNALKFKKTENEQKYLIELNRIYESCNMKFNDPDQEGIEEAINLFLQNEKLLQASSKKEKPTLPNTINEKRGISNQELR